MNEELKNSIWQKLPKWAKVVVIILSLLIAGVSGISIVSSCGVPRTAVTITDGGTSHVESNTTSSTTTSITIKNEKYERE